MRKIKGFDPMPDRIELRKSPIHVYGLSTNKIIESSHDLGIANLSEQRFPDYYILTSLGSFANHSITPNIKMIKKRHVLLRKSKRTKSF